MDDAELCQNRLIAAWCKYELWAYGPQLGQRIRAAAGRGRHEHSLAEAIWTAEQQLIAALFVPNDSAGALA
jgi:hypothetical protein